MISQPPLWLEVIQAVAAVATTIGVLVALYVAVIREPRKATEERRHHRAQMDALHRAERERVAAQARRVVPSCARTPIVGDTWWAVRIDNASNAVTTILEVDVTALDVNGFEVSHGCTQAPLVTCLNRLITWCHADPSCHDPWTKTKSASDQLLAWLG
jgi:hypothetical protein